jgi:hypothetical protein
VLTGWGNPDAEGEDEGESEAEDETDDASSLSLGYEFDTMVYT